MNPPNTPSKPKGLVLLSAAALFVLVALFSAACGDGNSGPRTATPTPGTAGTAATSEPAGTTSATSIPQTTSLLDLDSFRYEMSIDARGPVVDTLGLPDLTGGSTNGEQSVSVNLKGAWIKPDKAQLEMSLAGLSFKQTIIGDQQWTSVAGVTQGPEAADPGGAKGLTLANDFIDAQALSSSLKNFDCSKTENVNGIDTVRCTGDLDDYNNATRNQGGSFLGELGIENVTDFSSNIWLAQQGGYVVKYEVSMSGKDEGGKDFSLSMKLNVTDVGKVEEIEP